ncbi:relaxase domain-containing protein [Streptomyces achromogenes]|uniref:relaxase domain-containing protein n=1 Tax=Streptomyces achromogenes TaxID=67255 RepID=UPI0036BB2DA7
MNGKWGSVHTTALYENTVAASALYNELVAAEVCEALGLATEPRTAAPRRRPVMEIAGVPHELIRWTARRSDRIAACLAEPEHEDVTAVDDDGEPRFLPVVSERARAKLNQIAARTTRPSKQSARPLAQLRAWWKASAILTSFLEHARAAAVAIRARVAAVIDIALAAVDVAATVFVMNDGGRFHRRHLLAEARRHLALVLRGRRRAPGLATGSWPPPSPPAAWTSASRRPYAAWRPATASTTPGGPCLTFLSGADLPIPHPIRTGNPRPIPASRLLPRLRARTWGSGGGDRRTIPAGAGSRRSSASVSHRGRDHLRGCGEQ